MTVRDQMTTWLGRVDLKWGGMYQSILGALEAAIKEGELQPGDQLPTQRQVATLLGVDVNTVLRAYSAAHARGLIEATVGRGTFVSRRLSTDDQVQMVIGRNPPPPPHGVSLAGLLKDTLRAIVDEDDPYSLVTYHQGAGSEVDRIAGAMWVAPCMGQVNPAHVLISPGAQLALAAILTMEFSPGDILVTETLTYGGLVGLSRQLGIRLVGCATDTEGFDLEELERICREASPRGLYCVPTYHSATTATMSRDRRRGLAQICQKYDLLLIEDDAFGRLPTEPTEAVSTWARDNAYYISTLSKAISPALRHAIVVVPNEESADRLMRSLRFLGVMSSPLTSGIATEWIRTGLVERVLDGVRKEISERVVFAQRIFPHALTGTYCAHIWVDLPSQADNKTLMKLLTPHHLGAVTAELQTPCLAPPRNGVRLSLGSNPRRVAYEKALVGAAELIALASPQRVGVG